MQRKYVTQKGSTYVQTVEGQREYWRKEDAEGRIHALAAGVHIARDRLTELVAEYPSSLLDKTYCFDTEVEQEFFEDACRERYTGSLNNEPTVIFFLLKRSGDRFGIGCSSPVVRIEEIP